MSKQSPGSREHSIYVDVLIGSLDPFQWQALVSLVGSRYPVSFGEKVEFLKGLICSLPNCSIVGPVRRLLNRHLSEIAADRLPYAQAVEAIQSLFERFSFVADFPLLSGEESFHFNVDISQGASRLANSRLVLDGCQDKVEVAYLI